MLCNIAAAEFVMPIGSLPGRERLPPLEDLMVERRRFDVSVEAFLIRATKSADEPAIMFCASPVIEVGKLKGHRIDYTVATKSAPALFIAGRSVHVTVPSHRASRLAIQIKPLKWFFTKSFLSAWEFPDIWVQNIQELQAFFDLRDEAVEDSVKFIHGDVLEPRAAGAKIICQLVNDRARFWGWSG